MKKILVPFLLLCVAVEAYGQAPVEKRTYNIEVAGITVGKMTATKQVKNDKLTAYTLTSDVKVNFLVYVLRIFYQVNTLQGENQLMSARVDAHTNKGDFYTKTEKKENGYHVESKQHKSEMDKTITGNIHQTVVNLFFREPNAQDIAYAEYYGDFFRITRTGEGRYTAKMGKYEDSYFYKNGKLLKIIKKNPVKDFVMVLEE